MLAHLRRRWSLSGREGFWGGIQAFSRKWNAYFPLRQRWRNGGEWRSLGWPDAGPDAVSDWPDASGQCLVFARVSVLWSDAVVRPVMINRTRPVTHGGLLETNGCWHYGVWFIKLVRPVADSLERCSAWLARPVGHGTSASGRASRVGGVRTYASGQFDQRVRSAWLQ
jgi:hypothetical protein